MNLKLKHSFKTVKTMKHEKISFKLSLKQLNTLLLKDIKSEFRQINDLFSILLFDFISIFIFSSAYNVGFQNQGITIEIFVIEYWVILFFTLIFIMARIFVKEKESGTLNGLITSPISANSILISKFLFCLILLSLVEVFHFTFIFLFSPPAIQTLSVSQYFNYIIIGLIIPTLDLSVCGTIISAFSMYVKNKNFILPVLLFPILLPIISPIITMNIALLQGELLSLILIEFYFVLAHVVLMFSILFLISEYLLYD